MLVALLCILTTSLFALASATVSYAGSSGFADPRAETVIASHDAPSAVVAERAVADVDDPFEHGRLPVVGAGVPGLRLASRKLVVPAVTGPIGAEGPLPERPPRG